MHSYIRYPFIKTLTKKLCVFFTVMFLTDMYTV